MFSSVLATSRQSFLHMYKHRKKTVAASEREKSRERKRGEKEAGREEKEGRERGERKKQDRSKSRELSLR